MPPPKNADNPDLTKVPRQTQIPSSHPSWPCFSRRHLHADSFFPGKGPHLDSPDNLPDLLPKMERHTNPVFLETVFGLGYRFND